MRKISTEKYKNNLVFRYTKRDVTIQDYLGIFSINVVVVGTVREI